MTVCRDTIGAAAGNASIDINHRAYAEGILLHLWFDLAFPLGDDYRVASRASYRLGSYGALDEVVTETRRNTQLAIEWQFMLGTISTFSCFIGLGPNAHRFRHTLTAEDREGYEARTAYGPMLTLGFESPNLDLRLSSSVLYGTQDTSYDFDRRLRQQQAILTLLPRLWRIEVPLTFELRRWSVLDRPESRDNWSAVASLTPVFRLTRNLGGGAQFLYETTADGSDMYAAESIGGAAVAQF
jgi:hypothetical protein